MLRVRDHREGDEDGDFLNGLVALRDFVARESGAAARAVGDDLVALVEETLFVDRLERPPDGLDIVVVIGDVGVLHVRPVADGVAHGLPLALIFPNGFLAFFNERKDAVFLDLLLAVEAEALFDLQLDGQAVGIPARLAQHVIALHRAVAGDDVLH